MLNKEDISKELINLDKIECFIMISRRCTQNSLEMEQDQMMCQLLEKVKDFGMMSGASGRGIIKKQNS